MSHPETTPPPRHDSIALGIVTAREPVADNPWVTDRWTVLGAVVAPVPTDEGGSRTLRSGPEGEQFLWSGLSLKLEPGEADAYYYNLIGTNPSLYVYCTRDVAGALVPGRVTLEYIEAMAHGEFGNEVFAVPMPAEIYRRVERYVVAHFVPEEPRTRRKPADAERSGNGPGGGCR